MAKTKKARSATAGNALMKARDGVTGCSVGGVEHTVDENGLIEVPQEYVGVLMSHGFDPHGDEPADEVQPE